MLIPNKGVGDTVTHEEINQPFWLKSATYDAANDRIVVTIGPGRADWGGGTLTEKLTDSTLYITTPSINTIYYIFLKNDSTFIYSTSGIPGAGQVRLASIAVGATKDALTVSDLRGMLSTSAASHASTHASGGSDPVTPAAIGAAVASKGVTNGDSHDHVGGDGAPITEATLSLSDVTTADVSTTKHGFAPKAPNDTTKYLRGDGIWATVTATNSDTVDSYHAGNATNQVAVSNGSVCSTLNADLLDGYHSSSFAAASHTHPGSEITSPVAFADVAANSHQLETYSPGHSQYQIPISDGAVCATLNADLLDGFHKADIAKLSGIATVKLEGYIVSGASSNNSIVIQAASSVHRFYQLSAYTAEGPLYVCYGTKVSGSGSVDSAVHCFITRLAASDDNLCIVNTSTADTTVYYKVYQYVE